MNKKIMKAAGFEAELKDIENKKCPICKKPIGKFRDNLSKQEYVISGCCQSCIDNMFGVKK